MLFTVAKKLQNIFKRSHYCRETNGNEYFSTFYHSLNLLTHSNKWMNEWVSEIGFVEKRTLLFVFSSHSRPPSTTSDTFFISFHSRDFQNKMYSKTKNDHPHPHLFINISSIALVRECIYSGSSNNFNFFFLFFLFIYLFTFIFVVVVGVPTTNARKSMNWAWRRRSHSC